MTWAIHRMRAGDIDAVLALAAEIPEAPRWAGDQYERCVALEASPTPQRAAFIAEAGGRLLGFSVGKLVAGICELESIAVEKSARGQGVGRALLAALMDWAEGGGATRIELEVRASNATATKLYEQAGLRREGLRPAYYQSPEEDAVLMGRPLEGGGKLP
jgi:[ribosomal protein S18]-alanine N-acetyltransferase